MSEEKNWLVKLLDNWKAITATILIIVTTALAIRTAFWEYDDKAREREQRLKDENRTEDNLQQAYFINQIIKKQFDSLRVEIAQSNSFFYTNSIKKDSTLLIVFPRMSKEITGLRHDLGVTNQKINTLLKKEPASDKFDFMRILNERDSLQFEKVVNDSVNARIMRDIIRRTDEIKKQYLVPKFGDRVK